MTKDREERDAAVESCTKADPRQHHLEDSEIDVPQEHSQAGKEEEYGKM